MKSILSCWIIANLVFHMNIYSNDTEKLNYNHAVDIVFKEVILESIGKLPYSEKRRRIEDALNTGNIKGTINLLIESNVTKTVSVAHDIDSVIRGKYNEYVSSGLMVNDFVNTIYSGDPQFKALSDFLRNNDEQIKERLRIRLSDMFGSVIVKGKQDNEIKETPVSDSLKTQIGEIKIQSDLTLKILFISNGILFVGFILFLLKLLSVLKIAKNANSLAARRNNGNDDIIREVEILKIENGNNKKLLSQMKDELFKLNQHIFREKSRSNNEGLKEQNIKSSQQLRSVSEERSQSKTENNLIFLTQPNDDGSFYDFGPDALIYKRGIHVYEGRKKGGNLLEFEILDNDDALHFAIDNPNRVLLGCSEVQNEIRPAGIRGIKTLSPGIAELQKDLWVIKKKARIRILY